MGFEEKEKLLRNAGLPLMKIHGQLINLYRVYPWKAA